MWSPKIFPSSLFLAQMVAPYWIALRSSVSYNRTFTSPLPKDMNTEDDNRSISLIIGKTLTCVFQKVDIIHLY
jgi:hypothetical protein